MIGDSANDTHLVAEYRTAAPRLALEVERLQAKLDKIAPRTCPECGDHVAVDEDLCCVTCGSDTTEIVR